MPNKIKLTLRRNRLTSAIKLACSAGLLVSFALPASGPANEIVRSVPNTFGIPFRYAHFAAYPAVTYIDGQGYLQYIDEISDGDVTTYKNTIIGPFEALLDLTIPWGNLIYSREVINLPDTGNAPASLVDLDNDSKLELYSVYDNRLYTLSSSPKLIRDNLVEDSPCNLCDLLFSSFLDMDGDGDLDVFVDSIKTFDHLYFENTGTAEVPRFDREGVDAASIWEARKDWLPPGFYEQDAIKHPIL